MIRIIPAIDIIDGKCVRLTRGDFSRKVVYDTDPLRIARTFEDAGIEYLHLVDLDGARKRSPVNLQVLEMIAGRTSLKIDFGGGIRKTEDLELVFSLGASQITAGSIAVKHRGMVENWISVYGPEKIILGADVIGDKIAVSGWSEQTEHEIGAFIGSYLDLGVRTIICTQVLRDGELSGPDLDLYRELKRLFPDIFLIASGGIGDMDDVQRLAENNIDGVIIGKALYENKIQLKELERFLC
jgi:phosphoribosylformimino-5-aminoimidazole carboxamide ribotide isomerase